ATPRHRGTPAHARAGARALGDRADGRRAAPDVCAIPLHDALPIFGSCTMKYNPKINEDMARPPGFARLHPLAAETVAQGALQLMHELARDLSEIAGMDAVSLQPAAGAQGELAGVLMIRAYHQSRGA